MPRSPLALAALATVAVPGLDAYDVRRPGQHSAGTDTAVVIDAEGRRWVVRAPQNAAAGLALEAEVALLRQLVAHVDTGRLPFDVPRPAGFADLPEGGRAVVHPQLPGRPLQLDRLGPGPGLAAAVGRAVAAIHELPESVVEDAGLPVYEADDYRRRRLAEVDEAAGTGLVPTGLLRRWERALEDVSTWRFQPTVVHGDLSAEHVLCGPDRPTAVVGWSEAKVADPADDLAWLLVAAPQEAVDAILEAYNLRRTELRDQHLVDRALLAGELALARWLLHGVRMDDAGIVEDARAMLVELDEHTAEHDPAPAPVAHEAAHEVAQGAAGEAADASGDGAAYASAQEPADGVPDDAGPAAQDAPLTGRGASAHPGAGTVLPEPADDVRDVPPVPLGGDEVVETDAEASADDHPSRMPMPSDDEDTDVIAAVLADAPEEAAPADTADDAVPADSADEEVPADASDAGAPDDDAADPQRS